MCGLFYTNLEAPPELLFLGVPDPSSHGYWVATCLKHPFYSLRVNGSSTAGCSNLDLAPNLTREHSIYLCIDKIANQIPTEGRTAEATGVGFEGGTAEFICEVRGWTWTQEWDTVWSRKTEVQTSKQVNGRAVHYAVPAAGNLGGTRNSARHPQPHQASEDRLAWHRAIWVLGLQWRSHTPSFFWPVW